MEKRKVFAVPTKELKNRRTNVLAKGLKMALRDHLVHNGSLTDIRITVVDLGEQSYVGIEPLDTQLEKETIFSNKIAEDVL